MLQPEAQAENKRLTWLRVEAATTQPMFVLRQSQSNLALLYWVLSVKQMVIKQQTDAVVSVQQHFPGTYIAERRLFLLATCR